MNLHEFLDTGYGRLGDATLRTMLRRGGDPDLPWGPHAETPFHVAVRRRRLSAVRILLAHGADIDAKTANGKTAYVHAARRGFTEVCAFLKSQHADCTTAIPDDLAIAVARKDRDTASVLLRTHPEAVRTGNPEEDRLLADVAGRVELWPVELLLDAGADLAAPGLDGGTPLHQAAWFGQPTNARVLIARGAPLEVFDASHRSSPLGWAVHGSRNSGGARKRQTAYLAIVDMLLESGSQMRYPEDDSDAYYKRLLKSASRQVRRRLQRVGQ